MKKTRLASLPLVLFALASQPVRSGEHPDVLLHEKTGQVLWRAASLVVQADGFARPSVREPYRERIDRQAAWFSERHGGSAEVGKLADGPIYSPEFCMPGGPGALIADYAPPEVYGEDFDTTLLLSEVAAVATISEFIPGFVGSMPYLLVALSDVAPLHGRSESPTYLLVPVGGMVAGGRVYCEHWRVNQWFPKLRAGDGIVLIGRLSQGVVRTGPAFTFDLALVLDDGRLLWPRDWRRDAPPKTLPLLRRQVDEAVQGGLLEMTAPLLLEDSHSENRARFAETWWEYHQEGCRVRAAEELGNGTWQIVQTCGREERRIVQ